MDRPYVYEILVEGHLTGRWSGWFEELEIHNETDHQTLLTGLINDQAALFGVLNKIRGLNLILISVQRLESQPSSQMN